MNKPNPAVANVSIERSNDRAWLKRFRASMAAAGAPDIVATIDRKLNRLGEEALRRAIGEAPADLSLTERVQETVRVYGEFLAFAHDGKRVPPSRTKAMIARWGESEAVRRTVTRPDPSNGLERLARYGRLDCAYEQIIIDFPGEFDAKLIAKARASIAALSESGEAVAP